jgi:hypothetical protein
LKPANTATVPVQIKRNLNSEIQGNNRSENLPIEFAELHWNMMLQHQESLVQQYF